MNTLEAISSAHSLLTITGISAAKVQSVQIVCTFCASGRSETSFMR